MLTSAALPVVLALGGSLLLVASGLLHLRDRHGLLAVLAAQGVLPTPLQAPVARLWPWAETLVGVAAAAAVVGPVARPVAAVAVGIQAGCYLLFCPYVVALRRRAPGVACGCLGGDAPASLTTLLRAAVFALASVATAWAGAPRAGARETLLVLGAASLVAAMAWLLPELTVVAPAPARQVQRTR